MSNNPLSIIELMEKEYNISIKGDNSSEKRCFNELFKIDSDDKVNIEKIKSMKHIYELGDIKNKEELLYVENKIKKFIVTEPHHISECLELYNFTQEFCKSGLSNKFLPLLGKILNLEVDGKGDSDMREKMKIVESRLSKYIPDIIEKFVEISENYEKNNCSKISDNTFLLKKIHSNVMKKNASYEEYTMPTIDFDIKKFIEGFQTNILTKTIFLVCMAYIIGKVIGLFNINYKV